MSSTNPKLFYQHAQHTQCSSAKNQSSNSVTSSCNHQLFSIFHKLSLFLKKYEPTFNIQRHVSKTPNHPMNNSIIIEEEKIVDFFIFDHFNTTIPNHEWKEQLLSMSTIELIEMSQYQMNSQQSQNTEYHDIHKSLNDFVNECKQLMNLIMEYCQDSSNDGGDNNNGDRNIGGDNNGDNNGDRNIGGHDQNDMNNSSHHNDNSMTKNITFNDNSMNITFNDNSMNITFNENCKKKKNIPSYDSLNTPHELEKGLNSKKKYEIEILSHFIRNLSKQYQIDSICDIGGGQGYLSQKILIDQELEIFSHSNSTNPIQHSTCHHSNHHPSNENSITTTTSTTTTHHSTQQHTYSPQISHIYSIDCNHYLTQNATRRIKRIRKVLNQSRDLMNKENTSCEYRAITSHLSFTLNDEEFSKIVQELEETLTEKNISCNSSNDDITECHSCAHSANECVHNDTKEQPVHNDTKEQHNPTTTTTRPRTSISQQPPSQQPPSQQQEPNSLLFIGLHTCGSLASSIIQLFLASSKCHAMINIGCCYHKLCEGHSFPLSFNHHQLEIPPIYLSNLGKSMACLNPFIWNSKSRKDLKQCQEQFKLKSYRYAFQYLLYQRMGYDAIKDLIIRQPSKTNSIVSFGRFTFYTLQNLLQDYPELKNHELFSSLMNVHDDETKESFEKKLNDYYANEFKPCPDTDIVKKVEACWFFRSLIGPLLECYILLDRLLYLREQKEIPLETAYLKRIFDPSMSPRGFVLVAVKKRDVM